MIEEDDGSGWVKVADETGSSGLVPASYIELTEKVAASTPAPPPHGPIVSQGSGKFGMSSLASPHTELKSELIFL